MPCKLYNLSCLLQTYCYRSTDKKRSQLADIFPTPVGMWRNQLWQWLEKGCCKPVLRVLEIELSVRCARNIKIVIFLATINMINALHDGMVLLTELSTCSYLFH